MKGELCQRCGVAAPSNYTPQPCDECEESQRIREQVDRKMDLLVGLKDARAALAELWQRHDDDGMRKQCLRALTAVIQADRAIVAAMEFCSPVPLPSRARAYEELCKSVRLFGDTRKKL